MQSGVFMEQTSNIIHLEYAKKLHLTGKGIAIAYLDTGISTHRDFIKPNNRILCFQDFIHHRPYPYDDNGHGTHVAGIASSSRIGIAPDSDIVALKVLDHHGQGNIKHMIRCFQWILQYKNRYHIRIVNISIGMEWIQNEKKGDRLLYWVNQLWDHGLIVCIAGGNMGPGQGSITIPGTSRKVITVGSADDAAHGNYSGRGPTHSCIVKPDLVAPGTNLLSCYSSSHYKRRSGTSMATPIVSGAIALYLEQNPASSNKMIKLKLRSSCDNLGYPPNRQGWGCINIQKLLN
jgi:serine protease AprX